MLEDLLSHVPVKATAKQAVVAQLQEPQRCYHDLRHVIEMWQWHREFSDGLLDPRLVASYCLYHDAIYDPVAKDNEMRSAVLWMEDSPRELEIGDLVRNAIVASGDHFRWHPWLNVRWCLNLDLLRLGTPEHEFTQHGLDLRAEYVHLTDEDWLKKSAEWRAKVMSHSRIYCFPQFAGFEKQARHNLANALVRDWKALGYLV